MGEEISVRSDDDEILVIELDPRLEFGAILLDSDLGADTNSGCHNSVNCAGENVSCMNLSC